MGMKFSHYRSYDKYRGDNVIQATMAWSNATFIHEAEPLPIWVGTIVRRHPNDQPNKAVARTYATNRLNSLIVDYVTTPEIRDTILEDGAFFDPADLSVVTTDRHILQAVHKMCLAIPNDVTSGFAVIQRLYEEDRMDIINEVAAGNFHSYNIWVMSL